MSADVRPRVTLLLGGVRSGKSARALALAESLIQPKSNGPSALFVATAQAFDDEMTRKIAAHRAERSATWTTLESPVEVPGDLTNALATGEKSHSVVVIDCVTLWVSNILLCLDETANAEVVVAERVRQLLSAFDHGRDCPRHFILVSNEV
ncbi:MAG TPA: bifunctional adenosylcobinamide kinase/adenosylcobinamide-phosphate guanylyltransferase, partial [Gemmatimonadaceae bacterium]